MSSCFVEVHFVRVAIRYTCVLAACCIRWVDQLCFADEGKRIVETGRIGIVDVSSENRRAQLRRDLPLRPGMKALFRAPKADGVHGTL